MQRTSVLDVGVFREFCYIASHNNDFFQNFKNHQVCKWAIEYAKPEQGRDYLIKILSNPNFKISVEQWKNFLKNDLIGNPVAANYNVNGVSITCSPTTLRYIKVLSDIITYFDVDKIKTVAEIGVGYGGQCRILKNFLTIDNYNLIDLPETLALSEKFLGAFDSENLKFYDGTHLYDYIISDFFISNYAFSELQKPVQDMYIDKVVSHCKSGYISWDGQFSKTEYGIEGYELEDFLKKIPNPKVIPEEPVSTSPSNCIIMWGTK